MAKKRKSRRRQGIASKLINVALIALAFVQPIRLALKGNWGAIVYRSTFGLAGNPQTGQAAGKFDWRRGVEFYAPVGAAAALGAVKRYVMKKFPVR